jgi:hypothetical protein
MVAPTPSFAHTWMRGKINHFDFQAMFDRSFRNVLQFYCSQTLRNEWEEVTYDGNAKGYPSKGHEGHEGHEPTVRFLTAEEDQRFNHPAWVSIISRDDPR